MDSELLLLSLLSLPPPLERIEAADGALGLHEADLMHIEADLMHIEAAGGLLTPTRLARRRRR